MSVPAADPASTRPSAIRDADYTLEHKYTREAGRIYLSGVQALVRLPLMQQMRDRAAGLDTAGFISGYRGSPLGGFDLAMGNMVGVYKTGKFSSGDYSFDPARTCFADWTRVTLYRIGTLVWFLPPRVLRELGGR